ncbi:phospholipase A and acyltransferase 3-like, partial [Osmerus mordax]|uniref:phospholipase A and acyltransferase 3-like n=1 Tax=Osmerus mordax TaxID=8014 RepID=UPI0035100CBD
PCVYDKEPEPGDLIEIFRGMYQHWAMYMGDGFVIHFAPLSEVQGMGNSGLMSVMHDKATVKKEELSVVVGSDKWQVKNSLDKKYYPRPVDLILKDASQTVGEELPYSIAMANCEHFVTELRYGNAESLQVRQAGIALAVGTALFAMASFLIMAIARANTAGKKEKEKEYHY